MRAFSDWFRGLSTLTAFIFILSALVVLMVALGQLGGAALIALDAPTDAQRALILKAIDRPPHNPNADTLISGRERRGPGVYAFDVYREIPLVGGGKQITRRVCVVTENTAECEITPLGARFSPPRGERR